MLKEISVGAVEPARLWVGNKSAISTLQDEGCSYKSKHIDLKYKLMKMDVKEGSIDVTHTGTSTMHADIFTKTLPAETIKTLRTYLSIY